jgi:hypothetical protein
MRSETLQAEGEDGKSYVVIKTTPLILGSGLEGIPSYSLETGERLIPLTRPNLFRLSRSKVVITLRDDDDGRRRQRPPSARGKANTDIRLW